MRWPCLKRPAFFGVLLCFTISVANAQFRLYDAKRDAAAQEAKKTADKIQSGELFKKQERNLQALTEKDTATTVSDARVEMSTSINAFIRWSDIQNLVEDVKQKAARLPPHETKALQAKLAEQEAALQSQIKVIQAMATGDDPSLQRLADTLGQIDSVLKFAKDQLPKDQAAVTTSVAALDQLQTLYKEYQKQMQAVDSAVSKLQDLKIELKKALLGRLKVEEDYLLAKAALYERREKELEPVRMLLQEKLPDSIGSDDRIDETLQRLATNEGQLRAAVQYLFIGASLAARGRLPDRLYGLRVAELEHLRSIRLSAANARVYEAIVGGGIERLALYYQGGVRPEALAQIVQSLATTGIFGKIVSQ
jgi:hypothetical protein